MTLILTRRALVAGAAIGACALLSGCDKLGRNERFREILFRGEDMNRGLQRALTNRGALAREFDPAQMSPRFRVNGTANPDTPACNAAAAANFADWRLGVGGLVDRPLDLSMAQVRTLPARTQITRHDCVEGWSAIGKWHGARLGPLLTAARLRDSARYVVFTCADLYRGTPYYESIDLIDAFHPQTILAWAMNDAPLAIGHGAPIRLRVERQLGYKHAKFVTRIDAVASLDAVGKGKGGYWEDNVDYDWYAGI